MHTDLWLEFLIFLKNISTKTISAHIIPLSIEDTLCLFSESFTEKHLVSRFLLLHGVERECPCPSINLSIYP